MLVEAVAVLLATKWALATMPLRSAERLLAGRHAPDRSLDTPDAVIDDAVWAVEAASTSLPRSGNCLLRALALRTMLGRRGIHAVREMGFARGADGAVEGHAWLTYRDRVLIGGMEDLDRFITARGARDPNGSGGGAVT